MIRDALLLLTHLTQIALILNPSPSGRRISPTATVFHPSP